MFNTYIQEIGMRTITLMQYVFSIILLVIIFLVMDYFWKGDEFSWTYEFAKGGIGGTIICLLNRHLFLSHPNPKQKKI